MGKDVIIACDFASKKATFDFLSVFGEARPFVKIGMELFYAEGPEIVRKLKARGHKVFLDLKLHDIPNTVSKAMAVLSGLGADMINVHAAGGSRMMAGVLAAASAESKKPLVIAVTQLTSTDDEMLHRELLIEKSMPDTVMSYAKNAADSGLDGVVCSPHEADCVHKVCGKNFVTVTPGIRFPDGEIGDQKRIMSPADAKKAGSDYIVVGRPITASADPLAAYNRCIKEFVTEE